MRSDLAACWCFDGRFDCFCICTSQRALPHKPPSILSALRSLQKAAVDASQASQQNIEALNQLLFLPSGAKGDPVGAHESAGS